MKGLIDSTLREGGQTVGVTFLLSQKIEIIQQVSRVGIEEIEVGVATRLDDDLPLLMESCRRLVPQTSIALWSRCVHDDIALAAELRPDVLSLSVPASDLHIEKKFKRDRQWVVNTLNTGIAFALSLGIPRISVGLEDATRADPSFLKELVTQAHHAGAFRLRIADTVGVATPNFLSEWVRTIKGYAPLEIGVHTHNDFGMATANAISALQAGADWADVSVAGLGERAGCARLEEVAGFLALSQGAEYNTSDILGLSQSVATFTNRPITPNRPLVGSAIFTCETGLHLLGLEEDPTTYEPYHPEKVGSHRQLIYGSKIGRKNILQRLCLLGKHIPQTAIDRILKSVRQQSVSCGRSLSDKELLAACQE